MVIPFFGLLTQLVIAHTTVRSRCVSGLRSTDKVAAVLQAQVIALESDCAGSAAPGLLWDHSHPTVTWGRSTEHCLGKRHIHADTLVNPDSLLALE